MKTGKLLTILIAVTLFSCLQEKEDKKEKLTSKTIAFINNPAQGERMY